MRKLKKYIILILMIMIIPFGGVLAGCEQAEPVSIVSVEKTGSSGLEDTYTITYSDGTTSTFTVTNGADGEDGKDGTDGKDGENGKDGKDGADLTILDIYNQYVEENGPITYNDFLKQYLTLNLGGNSSVVGECLNSTMKVYTEFYETVSDGYSGMIKRKNIFCGAAIIYAVDEEYSYIVTNYHVVYDVDANADNGSHIASATYGYLYGSESIPQDTGTTETLNGTQYKVYTYGDYGIKMDYIGGSITYDIAVLRAKTSDIKAINENASPVKKADRYFVGESAIAIGNPEDEGISVTEGVVSVDNEYIYLNIDGITRTYRSVRIDTAIYHGSSGGGLFNAKGELIGITNAGDGTDQNVNYAIPLEIVTAVAEDIISDYVASDTISSATKITLGISVDSINSRYVYDKNSGYGDIVEDLVLSEVESDSIASAVGLEVGYQLTGLYVNETLYSFNRNFHIGDALLRVKAGDVIKFTYISSGVSEESIEYTVQASDIIKID